MSANESLEFLINTEKKLDEVFNRSEDFLQRVNQACDDSTRHFNNRINRLISSEEKKIREEAREKIEAQVKVIQREIDEKHKFIEGSLENQVNVMLEEIIEWILGVKTPENTYEM